MRPSRLERFLAFLVTVFILLVIFLPVAWMVISSISPREELLATPPHWIPDRLDCTAQGRTSKPCARSSNVWLKRADRWSRPSKPT